MDSMRKRKLDASCDPTLKRVSTGSEPNSRNYVKAVLKLISNVVREDFKITTSFVPDPRSTNVVYHGDLVTGNWESLINSIDGNIQDIFSRLCSITEVDSSVGRCLANYFKFPDGSYSINGMGSRTILLEDNIRRAGTVFPQLVWINVPGNTAVFAPITKTKIGHVQFELIGVIYQKGMSYGAVELKNGVWQESRDLIPWSELIEIISVKCVSLIYQTDPVMNQISAPTPLPVITLSSVDVRKIEGSYSDDKRRVMPVNILLQQVPLQIKLTIAQEMAYKLLSHILPESTERPNLTLSQYEELVKSISAKAPLHTNVVLPNSKSKCYLTVKNESVVCCYPSNNYTCCTVCLDRAEDISVNNRRYCLAHFPKNSVRYAVFIGDPVSESGSFSELLVTVIAREGYFELPLVYRSYNGHFRPDPMSVCIADSLEVARFIKLTMTVCLSARQAMNMESASFRKQMNKLSQSEAGEISVCPKKREEIFKMFGLKITTTVSPLTTALWPKEDAIRHGFVFGQDTLSFMRKIYAMTFYKSEDTIELYIGKNSMIRSVAYMRPRAHQYRHIGTECILETPNLKYLEYFESTIQVTCGLAAIHELEHQNKKMQVLNTYIDPFTASLPNVTFEEYVSLFARKLFNTNIELSALKLVSTKSML